MNKSNRLFLEALKASLQGRLVDWSEDITPQEWIDLFQIADIHQVTPMIYEAVYSCPALTLYGPGFVQGLKRQVFQLITLQAMRFGEFKQLYACMREQGIKPCLVKGIICRELYPNPDARISGDEDIFIPADQYADCHKLLMEYGMALSDPNKDRESAHEVAYGKVGSPVYVEVHKYLFPPESEAVGDLNRFFEGVHRGDKRHHKGSCGLIEETVEGTAFLTLNPTDHLLYLILHSFKHFLHSGFGLRQVCDINLYANAYGKEIDWDYVLDCLREVRADLFAAAMFVIGDRYLTFDPDKACYPQSWKDIQVDEAAMLEDLLASGVYGQADMSRKHSSNITLNAIIADKRGDKVSTGKLQSGLQSVCLPLSKLEGRYTYLKKAPFLLPLAWAQRVLQYRKETKGGQAGNKASESLRIGRERVELMRQYGIIK